MISWGAMGAVIAAGARIAAERAFGWHRQMRVTPLPVRTYFEAKVLTGYLMAGVTIVVLALAGLGLGVRLSAAEWVTMIILVLIGLIPFAVLGILVGHLVTVDSMGPAIGGLTALFALLGGAWGPIVSDGVLHSLAEGLPSYWLVQAGHAAVGGEGWPAIAWIVIAAWTLVLSALAVQRVPGATRRGCDASIPSRTTRAFDPRASPWQPAIRRCPGTTLSSGRDSAFRPTARWRGAE